MTSIQQARQIVGNQIGLPQSFDGSVAAYRELPAQKQVELNQAVLRYILANPANFLPAQVKVASQQVDASGNYKIEESNPVATFWDEFENQAVRVASSVASVGEGVVSSVSIVGNLLPVLVIVGLFVLALPYIKQATKE